MIPSTRVASALVAVLGIGGCAASDAGTSNVKYDPAAIGKASGDRPDLPPDAKAKMDAAMKGGAAKR